MRDNLKAFYRLLGSRAPGASVLERDGFVAAIVPSCPNQSIVNGVVYADAGALRGARGELEEAYRAAGVRAWRVWVHERDHETAAWLGQHGHALAVAPRAMTLELGSASLDEAASLDWRRSPDTDALASLNEQAYGLPAGEFVAALQAFAGSPDPGLGAAPGVVRLRDAGEPRCRRGAFCRAPAWG